jgi:hypothetical protein
MRLDPVKTLTASLLFIVFMSFVAFLIVAIITPNLRIAELGDNTSTIIQSSTNLINTPQISSENARGIQSASETAIGVLEDSCLVFLACAFCSIVGLVQVWRIKRTQKIRDE